MSCNLVHSAHMVHHGRVVSTYVLHLGLAHAHRQRAALQQLKEKTRSLSRRHFHTHPPPYLERKRDKPRALARSPSSFPVTFKKAGIKLNSVGSQIQTQRHQHDRITDSRGNGKTPLTNFKQSQYEPSLDPHRTTWAWTATKSTS